MKLRTTLGCLLAVTALTAGCGSGARPAAAGKSLDKVTLTLNWYPYGEHAPLYYGVKHGVFAKYGIDLTIQAGKGSGPTIQAVGGGKSDFGWADTPALMQAVGKGVPVRSLGVYLQNTPASVQFFTSEGITSPAALKGRRIAGTAGDALSKTFPIFLAHNGLAPSDVAIQNTDAAGKLAAVISGQVDALLGNANDQGPTIQGKTGKPMTEMRFSQFGLDYYGDGLIASDRELAKADLAKRMVQAVSESWADAAADPAAAVAAMAGVNPQTPPAAVLSQELATTLTLLHTSSTAGKPPGADTEADWQATVDTITKAGLVPSAQPVSAYWDESVALKG